MLLLALIACDPDPSRLAALDPTEDAALVAPTFVGITDEVLDGATISRATPFRSFRLVVAADPGAAFEWRVAGEGDWAPVRWDWSWGAHRNAHLVLPAAADTIEVRATGAAEFAQIELYDGAEAVHDDDGAHGVIEDVALYGRAHSGRWTLPADVWSLGQSVYLPYETADHCVGGVLPGTAIVGDWLVANTGASSWQGYACRAIGGTSSMSVHSEGRAIDLFVPTDGGSADNDLGDAVAEYLIANSEELGISLVIWDRSSWGAHRGGDKHQSYGGVHPHHDHLHIELTTAGALGGTAWFASEAGEEPFEGFVDLAATPSGDGYWLAQTDGGVFSFGAAPFHGSMGGRALAAPIVGMAATPTGGGYWLAGADGGVFAFGDAGYHGSMGGEALNADVVGVASTPSGGGYWLVAEDGGIFAFGDARFHGSMGGETLNAPVVAMAPTPTGAGYWLVAEDGGVFTFGDAPFYGSMGGAALNAPVTGMASTASGRGYWLVAEDGGVFSFGDARYHGSMGGAALADVVTEVTSTPGDGYWMVGGDGGVFTFGDAAFHGTAVP